VDQELLAIGTMPKSAAVASRKGDHKAPRFLGWRYWGIGKDVIKAQR
jgi:hypothetical protein